MFKVLIPRAHVIRDLAAAWYTVVKQEMTL